MSPVRSLAPRPKVVAGGVGGAASVVLVAVLSDAGVDVGPELAAALTTLLSFASGYLKRG